MFKKVLICEIVFCYIVLYSVALHYCVKTFVGAHLTWDVSRCHIDVEQPPAASRVVPRLFSGGNLISDPYRIWMVIDL